MSSIFLLLLTVVFMLLEVPQLPAKLQQLMSRPVEGMGAIQRALDSVSHYLVLKTAHQPGDRPGGLGNAGAAGRPLCFYVGTAGLCAQLHSQHWFGARGDPADPAGAGVLAVCTKHWWSWQAIW
ncbi:transporter [Klebsiella michiganensis]|uniref:Transporter n=1 Tax=Klebsiella michiganensis TaxID=1134687 RepID=A0A7H4PM39_9ENTR|nr:transporter [Klebsiella michiganensis]